MELVKRMSSSTSPSRRIFDRLQWRLWLPWLLAGLCVLAIESAVYLIEKPNFIERTNILTLAALRPEPFQRGVVYEKLRYYSEQKPDVVQAGDSSGFYGIHGDIVESYLPKGLTYANLSCCANFGYRGYYAVLDYFSKTDPNLKYFVLLSLIHI